MAMALLSGAACAVDAPEDLDASSQKPPAPSADEYEDRFPEQALPAAELEGVVGDLALEAEIAPPAITGTIEAIVNGDDGNNVLSGTADADELFGMGGNDTLNGKAGADLLDGGNGSDYAVYTTSAAGVTVDLTTGTGSGGDAEGDILVSIESLRGSAQADALTGDGANNSLIGDAGDDALSGGGGNDTLTGGAGADSLDGGSGADTVSYSGSTVGVVIDLVAGIGAGGDADGDTLVNVEHVRGTSLADQLTGNASANTLTGAEGDDILVGGNGDDSFIGGPGADVVDGGSGVDLASYATATAGVSVNLATGVGTGGEAAGDTLISIEKLRGSEFADVLVGSVNDDNIVGGAGNDVLNGSNGNDLLTGGSGADTLLGGVGADTISYSGSLGAITVNLAAQSVTGGDATGDVISGIENAVGTDFNDSLIGSSVANVLTPRLGDDFVDGGGGIDWIDYSLHSIPVTVNLALGQSTSSSEIDTFVNIENAYGGTAADTLIGNAAPNVFDGRAGNDSIDGGGGIDDASYASRIEGPFTIDLSAGTAMGPSGELDSLVNIENVVGTRYNDTITGNDLNNVLSGIGGADVIDGRGGTDMISFRTAGAGIAVDLETGTGTAGDAAGDTYVNIEDVMGSYSSDTIAGTSGSNQLFGLTGNDTLDGRGGNDILIGGAGADVITCGDGVDQVVYTTSPAGVTVDLATGTGSGGEAAGDTLSACENIRGSELADVLRGDDGANQILGGAGDDRIEGGGGADVLSPGAGADILIFAPDFGRDVVSGFAPGTDVLDISLLGIQDFAQVQAVMSQSGSNVLINFGTNTRITLVGMTVAQITAMDFVFAP
jgi:Ca2+-binding RTX toxin-like protein